MTARLPGLNGLRFLAALAVFVCHVEQLKGLLGLPNFFDVPGVRRLGPLGVTFFFVLSGFLITRLLLEELRLGGSINVKKFYWRRILRIWPVYYLVTALAFFVLPFVPWMNIARMPPAISGDYPAKLSLFLLMSAHVSQLFLTDMPYAGALWSASVEEHFYLLWPHLLRLGAGSLARVFAGLVVLLLVLKNAFFFSPAEFWWPVKTYFDSFRIGCMAIGALGAVSPPPKFLFRRDFQAALLLALGILLARGFQFPYVDDEAYSFLFLGVVLNVGENPRTLLKLRHPVFEYLGKISYGFYAYQWICIALVVKLAGNPLAIYAGAFLLTAAVAGLSYRFFEKPFLNLRRGIREGATASRARV